MLLEANADVSIKANVRTVSSCYSVQLFHVCPSFQQNHWTALHIASSEGHAEVVGVLLAAKATVNIQDKVSSTLSTVQTHDMLD